MTDYVGTLGMEAAAYRPDEPFRVCVAIDERHLNTHGGVHGGMLMSLCMEAVSAYVQATGRDGTGTDASIHYYRGAKPGDRLTAVVEERKAGKTLGNFAVALYNQDQKLLADAAVTVLFFR